MLDFENGDPDSEKQTRTTQIRHGDKLGDLIARAAAALAVDKSVFLRAAIAKEAARVLEAGSRHALTPKDAELFAAALDTPPPPTPRALAAAKAYRTRVVHAD
ncbi:MAG: DUF1778 domain-containing protein [Nisaea sp.]|uniref:type II toxin-antitoxin system TacA family antitoxin n=1 Tax=Nisaea sp. TaxID=2024842 RepID=UPI001B187141|nr:DUF1778 domain-containing protein [Nisaea sp.]MBO6559367.1 DUF1778 domain-containing protein [Nisaea sp.]